MDKYNSYQREFLKQLADIQTECVISALYNYKENQDLENFLFVVTGDTISQIMTLIDGYRSFGEDKMDIINSRTGIGVKENPFIELHDCVWDYLKYEKFPAQLDGFNVLEYSSVGDYGEISECNREIRYMAICQCEAGSEYYLFYCDSCQCGYKVLYKDVYESIDKCKEAVALRGSVWWNKKCFWR